MDYRHIVVAVDGSEVSQEALNQAVEIACQSNAALTGVFVVDAGWPDYIGNDWQSARGARQGFLDHVRAEQEAQAQRAREQFVRTCGTLQSASFELRVGDPVQVLIELANHPTTGLFVLSRRVFQVCGRPSLKSLGKRLADKARRPVLMLP